MFNDQEPGGIRRFENESSLSLLLLPTLLLISVLKQFRLLKYDTLISYNAH